MSKLSNLVLSAKTAEFEMPGLEGFKVTIQYQSRKAMVKLREESTVNKFNEEVGVIVPSLDQELLTKNFCTAVIKGWKGLTFTNLAKLVLIDESQIEDMDSELTFDVDTACTLMGESQRFDEWIVSMSQRLDNFRTKTA